MRGVYKSFHNIQTLYTLRFYFTLNFAAGTEDDNQ